MADPRRRAIASRRRFLQRAGTLGAALAAGSRTPVRAADEIEAVPAWTGAQGRPVLDPPYGAPSTFERGVVRRAVEGHATATASWSFTPLGDLCGIITPSGLMFERHHAGVPDIDPAAHRLMLHGMVRRPLVFTMDDLVRFPSVSQVHFLECFGNRSAKWRAPTGKTIQQTHGMLACCEWTGVLLSAGLDEACVDPAASWILAEGADAAAMTRSIPIEKARGDAQSPRLHRRSKARRPMIDTPKPTISQAEPDAVRSPVHSRRIASVRARVATGLAALVVSIPLAAQQLAFEPVADGLTAPIHLEQPADGRGRRFIMQQDGVVRVLDRDDGLLPDPFIDLRSRLLPLDKNFEERGLLGVAGDGTAVTGARLDRGEAIPDLVRKLVVSDWSAAFDRPSGQLFVGPAARWGDRWPYAQALQAGSRIVSLAEDVAGEIYVLTNETFGPYGTTGKMSRLVARP